MSVVLNSWLMVGLSFHYSVFSTHNYDTYQFGYQHELGLCILKIISTAA
jgi:hypothetical protein